MKPQGKVVAIIDSIISRPGYLLPWKELVSICREAKIWTIIDAAHSIGNEPEINLGEVQPDFWVSVIDFRSFGFQIPINYDILELP